MTISKDTELSEILKSEEVIDEICTKADDAISLLSERAKALSGETSSGKGLCEEQLVGDIPEFFNSATELYSNCTDLMTELSEFKNNVAAVSIEKERDELIELRKCLVEDNEAIDSLISGYELSYSNAKNYMPAEKLSQLYEEYKGANGYITLESAKKERNNEKIEEIDLRLDGDLANNVKGLSDLYKMYGATYDENGRVTKYGELDTSGGGRKMCDEDGHELNPDFEETPDIEPEKTDTVDTSNQHTKGDSYSIDGKDYQVEGYVTNSDGETIGIYKDGDGKLYYIDTNGSVQPVQAKMAKYKNANLDFDKYVYEDATDESIKGTEGWGDIKGFSKYVIDGKEYTYDSVTTTGIDSRNAVTNDVDFSTTTKSITDSNVQLYKDSSDGTLYYKNNETGELETIPWDITGENHGAGDTYYGGVVYNADGTESYDTVTINGQTYKFDVNNVPEYTNTATTPTTTDTSALQTIQNASVGSTVEYNGSNYSVPGYLTSSANEKIKVYEQNDELYYLDDSGTMKKALKIGEDYVIDGTAYYNLDD